jgi:hypothetical protein
MLAAQLASSEEVLISMELVSTKIQMKELIWF